MTHDITGTDYLRILAPWAAASAAYDYTPPDRPDLTCYGTGFTSWGVQTNQKALAALAVLAADPAYDERLGGMPRETVLDRARRMLRFSLESHIEGSTHCTDGPPWGHTWISALGIERMMHGVEAIEPTLTDDDRALLKKVLASECDWLLDEYPVRGGPVEDNVPESNLWNGALLHRTAAMYPALPRAAAYREKGSRFLINAISVPSDATSEALVDGRPVREWFAGNNFFTSYALNHHGYLNVGYMVICLSNLAMLHFMYRARAQDAPEALTHHARDLWALVKPLILPDGRLLRIGGDSRVRYCYCQDYAIPMWLWAIDALGDTECVPLESHWLDQVRHETDHNADGSFLSDRCTMLRDASPLYYTRLESDRAVTLSMGAYWRRILPLPSHTNIPPAPVTFSWHDDYHGAAFHRTPKRVASWVWHAAEPPQGLCLPLDASDMAEWRENLAGGIRGDGRTTRQQPLWHTEQLFEAGFVTCGVTALHSEMFVAEGQEAVGPVATQRIVFAALPDETTALLMQSAQTTDRRVYLKVVKGIGLHVPNDLFNDNRRRYHTPAGPRDITGVGSDEEILDLGGRWVNIDDRLGVVGVYGVETLTLHRPGRRQIGLRQTPWPLQDSLKPDGMLYADHLCAPCSLGLRSVEPNTILYDNGVLLQAGLTHDQTADYVNRGRSLMIETDAPSVRAMLAEGLDGATYLLVANWGDAAAKTAIRLPNRHRAREVATGKRIASVNDRFPLSLAPATAQLYRIE